MPKIRNYDDKKNDTLLDNFKPFSAKEKIFLVSRMNTKVLITRSSCGETAASAAVKVRSKRISRLIHTGVRSLGSVSRVSSGQTLRTYP